METVYADVITQHVNEENPEEKARWIAIGLVVFMLVIHIGAHLMDKYIPK